jgi:DNA-nicking Smr family endonuclease
VTGRDDRDDRDSFADHVPDVRPLAERERTQPPPEPRLKPRRRTAPTPGFEIDHSDGRVMARAPDVSRAILADLHAGRVPPERELDLHGLDGVAARRALDEALACALDDGLRCLLVIHGRGRRSPGEPVLQQAVPEWLASSPDASRIQAFASAPRRLGGAGACLVLLRRR